MGMFTVSGSTNSHLELNCFPDTRMVLTWPLVSFIFKPVISYTWLTWDYSYIILGLRIFTHIRRLL
jgi:hypothetical protein